MRPWVVRAISGHSYDVDFDRMYTTFGAKILPPNMYDYLVMVTSKESANAAQWKGFQVDPSAPALDKEHVGKCMQLIPSSSSIKSLAGVPAEFLQSSQNKGNVAVYLHTSILSSGVSFYAVPGGTIITPMSIPWKHVQQIKDLDTGLVIFDKEHLEFSYMTGTGSSNVLRIAGHADSTVDLWCTETRLTVTRNKWTDSKAIICSQQHPLKPGMIRCIMCDCCFSFMQMNRTRPALSAPPPQAALLDQDVIMDVASETAAQSDVQSKASGGSGMRPTGRDSGRMTNQQYKQRRVDKGGRLPWAADQSKQRRTAKAFSDHTKQWADDPEYRKFWSARGADRNNRKYLTHPPWVAEGPYDDPPRANPKVLDKFHDLATSWIGHTEWLMNHNMLPAWPPSRDMTASQWAMRWLMDYWNKHIAHLNGPRERFGPLDVYEDDRVIDLIDYSKLNKDEYDKPDWGPFHNEALQFMKYPWFNPYTLDTKFPGARPKSAGAPGASRAGSSSWSSGTALGAVVALTHPRGTGAITTGMQWSGTDEGFIPHLLVALETTLPELFITMATIMVLSVVIAWCYGRGYLKFSFEVGNSAKAKKNMTDKGMQTESIKPALQHGVHKGKGGSKGDGKSKPCSASGSSRSTPQSARSSRTPSVHSRGVSRAPASPPATPPSMRQIREIRDSFRYHGRPIERMNEGQRAPRLMTDEELRPPHLRPSAGDPWYYAPLSGSCYHLEQNCAGLRNAHNVQSEQSQFGKNRLIVVNGLRPCRMCAGQDRRENSRRRAG